MGRSLSLSLTHTLSLTHFGVGVWGDVQTLITIITLVFREMPPLTVLQLIPEVPLLQLILGVLSFLSVTYMTTGKEINNSKSGYRV